MANQKKLGNRTTPSFLDPPAGVNPLMEMLMAGGFLALPRDVLCVFSPTAWFPGDLFTASLYAYLVTEARWADATIPLPRQGVCLKSGQLVTSERKLAKALGVTHKRLRTGMRRACDGQRIGTQKGTHGTIVTIIDYDKLFLNTQDEGHTQGHTRGTRGAHEGHNQDKETKRQEDKDTLLTERADSCAVGDTEIPTSAYLSISNIWNRHRGALAAVTKLSPGRKRKLKCRWTEQSDESYWVAAVQKMATSAFCLQGGWATLDWLISNDTNHVKVSEGKYDNRAGAAPADGLEQFMAEMRAKGVT